MNKKEKRVFYLQYTVLFLAFMFIILYFHYSIGKATVNNSNDGFKQFYRALLYLSNHYKTILTNIFVNHSFVIPQWDFVLGEGGDIIEALHYYGLGDPINLLSVFFNESNLYIFHDLSIFIRMYLAGFVFSKLCFYKKHENTIIVLTGSILYAFSSYTIRVLTNYISFINPLIYFPMIVLGVEKLICEDEGKLLTIGVFLAAITSFYFFYMIVLFTVIYVAVRLLTANFDIKTIIDKLLKIFVFSLLGLLIGAFIFLPSAYFMLGNSRVSSSIDIPVFYDFSHYKELFTMFVFNQYSGWYYGGYTVLGLFSIFVIVKNKGNKCLKWLLLVSLVIMSFPFVGGLFNGMTYIVDRYEFFISLLMSYCVVVGCEEIINNKKDSIYCLAILFIYSIVSIINDSDEAKTYILMFLLGTVCLLAIRFFKNKKWKNYVCLFTVVVSILFVIMYKYYPSYWNYAETHGTNLERLTNIHNEEPSVLNKIGDNTFYRFSGNSLPDNVSVNGNKSSTGYYWSVANDNIAEFRTYNGFHDETIFYITNYDGDYILNTLSGVKYYFAKDNEAIPYGYKLFEKLDNNNLYINPKALPLFYGYDSSISIEEYENTPILERKELITQAVVTEESESNSFDFKSDVINVDSTISCSEGLVLNNSAITTTEPNTTIDLSYSSNIPGEYYFVIEDLYTDTEMNLFVTNSHDVSKKILLKTKNSHAYDDRHNFVINLGYYDNIEDIATLNIPSISNMTYSNIGIYCLPLKNAVSNLDKLNCIEIKDMTIDTNYLCSNINVKDDKYLCMSIPNYEGWKAYVDGKETELDNYNIMYMGFPIEKGNHTIELKYSTPLLKEGSIISLVSMTVFVIYEIYKKRNKI